jgi:hypothetical protein
MIQKDKKIEARPFDGEPRIGLFEIILGVLFFLLVAFGIYRFGVWLVG